MGGDDGNIDNSSFLEELLRNPVRSWSGTCQTKCQGNVDHNIVIKANPEILFLIPFYIHDLIFKPIMSLTEESDNEDKSMR